MADALERLTIVVPTYGRPDYVRRQVEFWDGSPVKLVIADGSPSGLLVDGTDFAPHVTYFHTDGDFHSRMLQLAELVSTEFVAVLGDDDFFSPEGLRSCVERLDRDPVLVGCVGRSIRFFFQDGRVLAEQRDPESSEFPEAVKTGLDRLNSTYHPGKIGALFYGVYRTQPWKEVVRTSYSIRFKTGYIYDTIIRALITYRGPVGVEEVVTWFCSAENPPVRNAPGMDRTVGFVEWLSSESTAQEVQKCQELIVRDLVSLGSDDAASLTAAVKYVFDELLRRYELKAEIRMRPMEKFRRVLVGNSPRFIKRLGKQVMPQRLRSVFDWTMMPMNELVENLKNRQVRISDVDVDRICRAILRSHG